MIQQYYLMRMYLKIKILDLTGFDPETSGL